ncbi:MAG: response regulator [Chloroflexi bacterium AL-W]|nr:response regulator [Chloroflexi bacterium AL-N1]NOK65707.1 response regulator [Chloroflexi bacterium AL-N10]NOK74352.1 response regulator [Chloroflexi bacterium AL-N5]NOK80740.1 response regulator [Chloroflexi bacterium AL-W]NOK88610.1 response regulator [Chloroflexi bacterium AL-N15]
MPEPSILIIDDEHNQRLMLEQAFQVLKYNWHIATVATGQHALEFLSQSTPNLIITDYHMPMMDGLELITHIRQQGIASTIILITAYSSPMLDEAAQNLQIHHYLTKPVPLSILRDIVTTTMNNAHYHDD